MLALTGEFVTTLGHWKKTPMSSKQTKIICTLGEDRCSPDFIQQLVDSGMDVVRLNTAHLEIPAAEKIVTAIRAVSDHVGVLLDTKGPEVRTCNMSAPLLLKTWNPFSGI